MTHPDHILRRSSDELCIHLVSCLMHLITQEKKHRQPQELLLTPSRIPHPCQRGTRESAWNRFRIWPKSAPGWIQETLCLLTSTRDACLCQAEWWLRNRVPVLVCLEAAHAFTRWQSIPLMYLSHVGGRRSCGVDEALTGTEMRRTQTVIRALTGRRLIAAVDIVMLFPDQKIYYNMMKRARLRVWWQYEELMNDNLVVIVFFFCSQVYMSLPVWRCFYLRSFDWQTILSRETYKQGITHQSTTI